MHRPCVRACRAKRRQARLEAAAEQLRRRGQGPGPGQGGDGGAELRLGEATSEESEGEAAHFRLRQGEIQEVRCTHPGIAFCSKICIWR